MLWNALVGLGVILVPLLAVGGLGYFLGPALRQLWYGEYDTRNLVTQNYGDPQTWDNLERFYKGFGLLVQTVLVFVLIIAIVGLVLFAVFTGLAELGSQVTGF